jgi:hypothetical protein
VLERFLARTVYPTLTLRDESDGSVSVWRDAVQLADGLPAGVGHDDERLHAAVGWTVFLQEVWGEPGRAHAAFYDGADAVLDGADPAGAPPADPDLVVEVAGPLADHRVTGTAARVEVRAGGAFVTRVRVAASEGVIVADRLRSACTAAGGYSLCQVVVREALLGRPLVAGGPLRARLARGAAARDQLEPAVPAHPPDPSPRR